MLILTHTVRESKRPDFWDFCDQSLSWLQASSTTIQKDFKAEWSHQLFHSNNWGMKAPFQILHISSSCFYKPLTSPWKMLCIQSRSIRQTHAQHWTPYCGNHSTPNNLHAQINNEWITINYWQNREWLAWQ